MRFAFLIQLPTTNHPAYNHTPLSNSCTCLAYKCPAPGTYFFHKEDFGEGHETLCTGLGLYSQDIKIVYSF